MNNWYILNFRGSERSLGSALSELKAYDSMAEVWEPCYFVKTKLGVLKKSLYPGYLFVKFNYDQKYDDYLRRNHGGSCFLKDVGLEDEKRGKKSPGKPYFLREDELKTIKNVELLCDSIFRTHSEDVLKECANTLNLDGDAIQDIASKLNEINTYNVFEGEQVEIIEGPFNFLKGKVLEVKDDFLTLEVDMLSRKLNITVGVSQCQKVV